MDKVIRKISNRNGGNLSIEDLEHLAHNPQAFKGYAKSQLSYFTGQQPQNFTNTMNEQAALVLGQLVQAPWLTIDQKRKGIQDFVTSKSGKNSFSIELKNTGSSDIDISLLAGVFRGTSLAPNALLDTVTNLTVTSKTPNKLVQHLVAQLNSSPTLLSTLRIQSTDPNQVVQPFVLKRKYAFSDDTTNLIDPSNFKTAFNTIDTFLVIKVDEPIDEATILGYTVRAGATVTLTFQFAISYNKSVAFNEFLSGLTSASNFIGDSAIQNAAAKANFLGEQKFLG